MTYLFIINPFAGNGTLSDQLRDNIHRIEYLKNKEVLIFNSEYPGHETILVNQVMQFLPNEDFFIFVCAGTGSFHYALNADLNFAKIKLTHVACGTTNNDLKVFGNRVISRFTDINELLLGDTLYLDYIKTNCANAINTISCGYSAKIIQIHNHFSFFSTLIPNFSWFFSGFLGIISERVHKYEITIDGIDYSGDYHEIICANGRVQGGALFLGNEITPDDGLLNFILIPQMNIFSLIKTIMGFYFHNPKLFHKKVIRLTGKTFSIKRTDGKQLKINMDSEITPTDYIEGKIIPGKLPFVVPKGVKIKHRIKKGSTNGKK